MPATDSNDPPSGKPSWFKNSLSRPFSKLLPLTRKTDESSRSIPSSPNSESRIASFFQRAASPSPPIDSSALSPRLDASNYVPSTSAPPSPSTAFSSPSATSAGPESGQNHAVALQKLSALTPAQLTVLENQVAAELQRRTKLVGFGSMSRSIVSTEAIVTQKLHALPDEHLFRLQLDINAEIRRRQDSSNSSSRIEHGLHEKPSQGSMTHLGISRFDTADRLPISPYMAPASPPMSPKSHSGSPLMPTSRTPNWPTSLPQARALSPINLPFPDTNSSLATSVPRDSDPGFARTPSSRSNMTTIVNIDPELSSKLSYGPEREWRDKISSLSHDQLRALSSDLREEAVRRSSTRQSPGISMDRQKSSASSRAIDGHLLGRLHRLTDEQLSTISLDVMAEERRRSAQVPTSYTSSTAPNTDTQPTHPGSESPLANPAPSPLPYALHSLRQASQEGVDIANGGRPASPLPLDGSRSPGHVPPTRQLLQQIQAIQHQQHLLQQQLQQQQQALTDSISADPIDRLQSASPLYRNISTASSLPASSPLQPALRSPSMASSQPSSTSAAAASSAARPANSSRVNARARVGRLNDTQLRDFGGDVYDDVKRRAQPDAPAFLEPRDGYSTKRNMSRKELARLPNNRLQDLWNDICEELEKRNMKL